MVKTPGLEYRYYLPSYGAAHGFVYLVAIIDLYSWQVLAWEVSDSFCVSALGRALRNGNLITFTTVT